MDKIWNNTAITLSLFGGIVCKILGGWDGLLYALTALVIVDYITGVIKGIITKEMSSKIGFKGLAKKVLIFCLVAVSVVLQKVIGDTIPLREVVIMFYIANEGLSILENVGEFLPLPDKLKEILIQIRDTGKDRK